MDGLLAAVVRETGRLEKQARVARRAMRSLQDELGQRLGSYRLAAGAPLDDREVLDFLHLAIGEREGRQEIRITVTAPRGALASYHDPQTRTQGMQTKERTHDPLV